MQSVNIGIFGLGNIGKELFISLVDKIDSIKETSGYKLNISKVLVRDITKKRNIEIERKLLTNDPDEILSNKNISIVIELMGGAENAYPLVKKALKSKKSIITANKDLIATYGIELFKLAKENNVSIFFEAAVASGTPIISTLMRDLSASNISSIRGIINGTSNFILSEMEEKQSSFKEALDLAQNLGYAEPDPSNDITGLDACYKLAILTSLAFNTEITFDDIFVEGIDKIEKEDFDYAKELGYTIKLLGITEKHNNNLLCRVHPILLNLKTPLAKISGPNNAIEIKDKMLGELIIQGPGAGPAPTASAVLNDLVSLLNNQANLSVTLPKIYNKTKLEIIDRLNSKFYLRFEVIDEPGVLAKMSNIFGEEKISIASVIQKENKSLKKGAELVFMTHNSSQSSINKALKKLYNLDCVNKTINVLRVSN
jgi:homoserine dehydrogenase|tara:strand:+ start:254 stop:1537 length:1284 start_codon:yes stop_codon:yes gene_type:complete